MFRAVCGDARIRSLLLQLAIALAAATVLLAAEPPSPSGREHLSRKETLALHERTAAAQLYTLNCWGCHQTGGKGIPGTVPRLSGTVGYFLHVPGGRQYLVQVPGVAGSALSDAEVAEVMNWLLKTFSKDQLPKNFKPYTAAEVAKYRAHELTNIRQARGALITELAARGIKIPTE